MLDRVDLSEKLSKKHYKKIMDDLGERLGLAQRAARDAKRPIIIVFEGWRGSHRSAVINTIMQYMDARGFDVYSTVRMEHDEKAQPFFTFFWQHLPADGNIAVYHRSWYYLKNLNDITPDHEGCDHCKHMSFGHINAFEKVLTDDNYIVLKYFLHISEETQVKRLQKGEKTLGKAWREVNPAYDESNNYKEFYTRYDNMLEATNKPNAPWMVVAADDPEVAGIQVFTNIVERIENALEVGPQVTPEENREDVKYDELSKYEPYQELSKEQYKKELAKYQKKLAKLQIDMFRRGISAVIGFEGWDAAGKGGSIRRLTEAMDPLGYTVHPVAAPNAVERQFNHLWRFWINLPQPGNIAIFDRTWYGRVMVERLEGFAQPGEWQRAYEEMNDMEEQWAEHGMVVLKFWLQIDKDEQLRRFTDRQNTPNKQWKITEEDWRNRDKWEAYEDAVNEMIARTNKPYAPWVVVEGNNKYYARIKVIKTVCEAFEKRLKNKM
ncbi:MAG: polyphosphate:AMP phosphotransferase [Phascolarctobacterium sp.]|nr:polyphosphate:AMP phosphotransferase [Phascolarctobacterium sp.]